MCKNLKLKMLPGEIYAGIIEVFWVSFECVSPRERTEKGICQKAGHLLLAKRDASVGVLFQQRNGLESSVKENNNYKGKGNDA